MIPCSLFSRGLLIPLFSIALTGATSSHPSTTTLPAQGEDFLHWFEGMFFGFPADGAEQGTSQKFGIAVRTQTLPDAGPNLQVQDVDGNARFTVKEYDLRFLSGGNAETLHKALVAFLSDRQIVARIDSDYYLDGPRIWLKSSSFAWSYQNKDRTLIGSLIVSIRDTEARSAILTLQHWESLIHPRE